MGEKETLMTLPQDPVTQGDAALWLENHRLSELEEVSVRQGGTRSEINGTQDHAAG